MKFAPWFAMVVLLTLAAWFYGCEQKRQGALHAEIAQLKTEARQIDTVYLTKTKTLVKVRRVTDSVLVTDTLIHRDTVMVLVQAEREACDAVISTCERKVANLNAQLDKVLEQRPGWVRRTFGCAAGAAATTEGSTGLGVACGVKFP